MEVTVTDPSGPPVGLANECASPQNGWIWCDDFEQDRLGQYFEYDDSDGSFGRLADVGVDNSTGLRALFEQGDVSAGSLKVAFGRTPAAYFEPVDDGAVDYRDLYFRFLFRYPSDWTGGGGVKMARATIIAGSNWSQAMIAHLWSDLTGEPSQDHLVIDPASGTDAAGNLRTTQYNDFSNLRWLGSRDSSTPIFDSDHVGGWHCVESRVRLNDEGQSNGVFQLWIDGVAEASRTDLNWVGAYDAYGINAFFLENYWNDGAPRQQERYFDNLVVSTTRIGCGG